MFINHSSKQVTAKIVYYGPGLSGKTSNLQYIFSVTNPKSRGELVSIETDIERTLFFDLLPINVGLVSGYQTRFQLYTVPGQVFYDSTRRLVLKGADGIVFVADSQELMEPANTESYENLKTNLLNQNQDLKDLPLVFQFNKRDLKNISPVERLNKLLNTLDRKYYKAIATKGDGVIETLREISSQTLKKIKTLLDHTLKAEKLKKPFVNFDMDKKHEIIKREELPVRKIQVASMGGDKKNPPKQPVPGRKEIETKPYDVPLPSVKPKQAVPPSNPSPPAPPKAAPPQPAPAAHRMKPIHESEEVFELQGFEDVEIEEFKGYGIEDVGLGELQGVPPKVGPVKAPAAKAGPPKGEVKKEKPKEKPSKAQPKTAAAAKPAPSPISEPDTDPELPLPLEVAPPAPAPPTQPKPTPPAAPPVSTAPAKVESKKEKDIAKAKEEKKAEEKKAEEKKVEEKNRDKEKVKEKEKANSKAPSTQKKGKAAVSSSFDLLDKLQDQSRLTIIKKLDKIPKEGSPMVIEIKDDQSNLLEPIQLTLNPKVKKITIILDVKKK